MRVMVLMGGTSYERDVSLTSGKACFAALSKIGYEVTPYDFKGDVSALVTILLQEKIEVVFNALHGTDGEDGAMQGLLELLKIPYTHSGILASALAMNKISAKHALAQAGIPVAQDKLVNRKDLETNDPFPRPYVLKPTHEGSSVGISIIKQNDTLDYETIFDKGRLPYVMAEPFIPGRELTCAVMGDRALSVTELLPKEGFYDYRAKYTPGCTDHKVPASIPDALTTEIKRLSLLAHRILGCNGVTRSDFRYNSALGVPHGLFMLELNTQPGMTELSLVPEQAAYVGLSFTELVEWILNNALCRA